MSYKMAAPCRLRVGWSDVGIDRHTFVPCVTLKSVGGLPGAATEVCLSEKPEGSPGFTELGVDRLFMVSIPIGKVIPVIMG